MLDKIKHVLDFGPASAKLLTALVFLLPVFFIPFSNSSLEFIKYALFTVVVTLVFLLWLVTGLRSGEVSIPKTYVVLSGVLLVIATFVSALFTENITYALLGSGAQVGSAVSILATFLLLFLTSIYFQSTKRVIAVYALLIISFFILSLFQILRVVLGYDFLQMGVFTSPDASLIGSWNNVAVFVGLIVILLMTATQLVSLKKMQKVALCTLLTLALAVLSLINFHFVWVVLAIFSIAIFAYVLLSQGLEKVHGSIFKTISFVPLVVAFISIEFLLSPQLGAYLSSFSKVQNIESHPSWSTTIIAAENILEKNPWFGTGPDAFLNEWLLIKPESVNQTMFWNSDFNFGAGMIPTFAINSGLTGIGFWALFLCSFLFLGIKTLGIFRKKVAGDFLTVSSFFAALYSWVVAFFYVPNVVGFIFPFFFTGLSIAVAVKRGAIKNKTISFLDNQKRGFVLVLIFVLLIISTISLGHIFVERCVAAYNFSKGITAFNAGDFQEAEHRMTHAVELAEDDEYYRILSEVQTRILGEILNQETAIDKDAIRLQFYIALRNAITSAQKAININKTDYTNWLAYGNIFSAVIPLGVDGAYEKAVESYSVAASLNPKSPYIQFLLARNEIVKKDNKSAKEYLDKAIGLKSNYTNAILVRIQLDLESESLDSVLKRAEEASLVSSDDMGAFFKLGVLKYQKGDYHGSVSALQRSTMLDPLDVNAKKFLGLTYIELGAYEEAIQQFEHIKMLGLAGAEIERTLTGLREALKMTKEVDVE